jgi:hypothetical protein
MDWLRPEIGAAPPAHACPHLGLAAAQLRRWLGLNAVPGRGAALSRAPQPARVPQRKRAARTCRCAAALAAAVGAVGALGEAAVACTGAHEHLGQAGRRLRLGLRRLATGTSFVSAFTCSDLGGRGGRAGRAGCGWASVQIVGPTR